ncbi:hypothetical protein FOL46_001395 [Perkinsus olseni]|uniref:Uncharacterized protein n=1 Tax=Perkinsus olseni TaxID=32597 RepID=A0A7J6MVV4_PEROL|nr:hypothetical protein FOL46_001395 [Perkinsus olseni]
MFKKVALFVLCALMASELSGCSSDSTTTTPKPTTNDPASTHAALRTTTQTTTTTTTTTTSTSTVNCMNGDYYCQVMSGNKNSYCRYYGSTGVCQGLDIPCNCDEMPPTTKAPPPTTSPSTSGAGNASVQRGLEADYRDEDLSF